MLIKCNFLFDHTTTRKSYVPNHSIGRIRIMKNFKQRPFKAIYYLHLSFFVHELYFYSGFYARSGQIKR